MDSAESSQEIELFHEIERLFEEMVVHQRRRLEALARSLDPALSSDDLLSPDDFPILARDPRFQFEDGLLAGLLSARTAIRARVIAPRVHGPEEAR
ncbi:MAG: hypothetical protein HY049_16670 [Acidobacteria bacterium]|nr:hypothetical protein [Acidobacteriota bacterium]